MSESKNLDAEAKLARIEEKLWEELQEMDHEASEMLQELGLNSEEVRDRSMGAFCEAVEKRDMSIWADLPAVYGAYGGFNLGAGLLLRYLEKGPQCVDEGDDYYGELVGSLRAAAHALGALESVYAIETGKPSRFVRDMLGKGVTMQARRAALARAPHKRAEKEFVKQCWEEWRIDHSLYKSKAAFARDMLDKCEHITSQKKIEDWCREWGTSTKPAQ